MPPLRVRRHDQASAPHQTLLREYLRGRLRLDPERPQDWRLAEDIIGAADGRFAYVSFLADRLEQLPPGDLAGLGAGEGLYRRWLAGLDVEYMMLDRTVVGGGLFIRVELRLRGEGPPSPPLSFRRYDQSNRVP